MLRSCRILSIKSVFLQAHLVTRLRLGGVGSRGLPKQANPTTPVTQNRADDLHKTATRKFNLHQTHCIKGALTLNPLLNCKLCGFGRIWGIWGSHYNIPKAILYLLKGGL